MADVCEAFRFFRVFSGLIFMSIRVHSWFPFLKYTPSQVDNHDLDIIFYVMTSLL